MCDKVKLFEAIISLIQDTVVPCCLSSKVGVLVTTQV